MKCDTCGAHNSEQNVFCVSCGRPYVGTSANEPPASNFAQASDSLADSGTSSPPTHLTADQVPPVSSPQTARRSNVGLIVGSVIGILGLVLGGALFAASISDDSPTAQSNASEESSSSSASAPGGDSYLDRLWRECDAGDFQSCDDLFSESPSGSDYEDFGDTCGNRNEPSGWCVDIYW